MSFLDNYSNYASNNEAPQDYHKWAALSVMSSIVSRKVWIDQGIFTIWPNLYIIFVGPPGNGKSTAMQIAQKMTRAFGDIPIAPAAITKEAITQLMGNPLSELKKTVKLGNEVKTYTPLHFFANEMTTLLGASPIPMIDFFTNIYDQDEFEVHTKGKGIDKIHGPFINILGCMTPDVTSNLLKMNIISGGFNRRCVFVNALKRGKGVPFPEITPAMRQAWDECLTWGKKIQPISGQFTWCPEAKKFFSEWYNEKTNKVNTLTNIVVQGYYLTKDVMLLKVAMLIALSQEVDLILRRSHLEQGLDMLNHTEGHLERVFSGTGRNQLTVIKSKLLQILEVNYPNQVSKRAVEASLYELGTMSEIAEVVTHCNSTGVITIQRDEKGTEFYKLKKSD